MSTHFFLASPPPKQGEPASQWNALADLCKTIITLASALLALTVTFSAPLLAKAGSVQLWSLRASWALLFALIVFGTRCYFFVIAYLRSGLRDKELSAIWYANGSFFVLALASLAILVSGLAGTWQTLDAGPKAPEVHIHVGGAALSFEFVSQVSPFVTGKADVLEPAASASGTTVGDAMKALADHGKGRELVCLLLVGSADKFELQWPLKAEYGSNSGLARARAEWVRELLIQGSTKVLTLTVGPRKHGTGLSVRNTSPDRGVAIYAAWRDSTAVSTYSSR